MSQDLTACWSNDKAATDYEFVVAESDPSIHLSVRYYNPTTPSCKGVVIAVHGICSHSRFDYYGHPRTAVFNEDWAKRKATLINEGAALSPSQSLTGGGSICGSSQTVSQKLDAAVSQSPSTVKYLSLSPNFPSQEDRLLEPVTYRKEELTEDQINLVNSYKVGDIPCYENGWVYHLNQNGWIVVLYDQQGHGTSEGWKGTRCNVEKFDNFINDLCGIYKHVRRTKYSDQHIFIMGISMGGLVTARFAETYEGAIPKDIKPPTGVILLAPALGLDEVARQGVNRLLRPVSKVLTKVAPHAHMVERATNDTYCYVESLVNCDPLFFTNSKLPVRICAELLEGSAASQNETMNVPPNLAVAIYHSRYDTMCSPTSSVDWMKKLNHVKDKGLWLLDDSWHFVTIEPGYLALLKEILSWLDHRI